MRILALTTIGLLLSTTHPAVPASAPSCDAADLTKVCEVSRYSFKRMHLVRPDLVTYPVKKLGRTC
jgi:hypothetical protein